MSIEDRKKMYEGKMYDARWMVEGKMYEGLKKKWRKDKKVQKYLRMSEILRIFAAWNVKHVGVFDIETFEMTEGDMPNRAQKMVKEWLTEHKNELQEMWKTQKIVKLPPLED